MPVPHQQGDIATRLRRFFNLTGRITTQLDEQIVPVTLVHDGARMPFADWPLYGVRPINIAASAGNVRLAGVQAGPDIVVLVTRFSLTPGSATSCGVWRRNADISTAGMSSGTEVHARNRPLHGLNAGGAISTDFTAAAIAGLTEIGHYAGPAGAESGRLLYVDFPWLLYPGDSFWVGPKSQNIAFQGWIDCEIYPNAALVTG